MRYININGQLLPEEEACIRADNRGFRYGYSLFETMLVRDGRIRLGAYHWERLFGGLALLGIRYEASFPAELQQQAARTITRNGLDPLCRLRIQVYAGEGGLYEPVRQPGYVIETIPLQPADLQLNKAGLVIGISDVIKHTGALAQLKTGSALPYAIAARQAADIGWHDAVLLNEHGNIADSTIANIFWVKDGKINTPPLSDGCVAGIMRRYLLGILPGIGYETVVQSVYPEQLRAAEGIFLCNAVRGIRWVEALDGCRFSGEIVQTLHENLRYTLL